MEETIKKPYLRLAARQPVIHRYSAKRKDYRQAFCAYLDEFYND